MTKKVILYIVSIVLTLLFKSHDANTITEGAIHLCDTACSGTIDDTDMSANQEIHKWS